MGRRRGHHIDAETVGFAVAVAIYCKAFLEELGKRSGEAVANLVELLAGLLRTRKAKAKPGIEGQAALIAVAEDTPDEARLALLDLDVSADALRGKTLRWDGTAGVWLPDDKG